MGLLTKPRANMSLQKPDKEKASSQQVSRTGQKAAPAPTSAANTSATGPGRVQANQNL
jgi:hypothetical protein